MIIGISELSDPNDLRFQAKNLRLQIAALNSKLSSASEEEAMEIQELLAKANREFDRIDREMRVASEHRLALEASGLISSGSWS
ncbi:MAG: hypothetical protein Q7S48_03665 [bacterium]|nr:hypothetical protein [bacterium]